VSAVRSSPARESASVAVVHERLRAAILHGELKPGSTIPQGTLASEFDTGRTPLREALRMLQREGLVISEPNRPVRVAPLSSEDFEAIHVMRIPLEIVAVHITVPVLTSDDVADLEGYMAQMEHYQKVGDQAGLSTPHRAFHHRLVSGAGERVCSQIAQFSDHSERYRLRFWGSGPGHDFRVEHREILDAAAVADADLAARRLALHYARAAAIVFAALDPNYDPERLRITIRTVAPNAEAELVRTGNHPGR
jgi:DNA-binding GntR family transcriptional regulator